MLDKILRMIGQYHMLGENDTAVCGLSGGADSVCLLLALYELRERLGINVEALHVNHGIRGGESDRDEDFCRELCGRLGVPFTAVRCDVPAFAGEKGLSLEEAARELRYGIFAENSRGKKLATAHNAGDNLETVLLNLTRGTALRGMAGIPPVRGNIIRPLLSATRQDIEGFLASRGQSYVTDSTNLSDDYTRNKLRHRVIPMLEEINGSVIAASVRSIEAMRDENSLIEEETAKALEMCRKANTLTGLRRFHRVIRRRCIAALLSENRLPYSHDRLAEADRILMEGGKLCISGDTYLVGRGDELSLASLPREAPEYTEKELQTGENLIYPGKGLLCEVVNCDDLGKIQAVNKKLTIMHLDYDKIKGRAFVRGRKFGDRIQLPGRDFTSSVKKLINENIPQELRSRLCFIEDEEGTIYAEGLGIAQRTAPDESTRRLLRVSVINTTNRLE